MSSFDTFKRILDSLAFLHHEVMDAAGWLLLAVSVSIGFSFYRRSQLVRAFGDPRLAHRFTTELSVVPLVVSASGWLIVVALLMVAAAGPTVDNAVVRVPPRSICAYAVFDVSISFGVEENRLSMPPKDGVPPELVRGPYGTRLDLAKKAVAEQILPALGNNYIGLASFKGAVKLMPTRPTSDPGPTAWVLDHWVQLGDAPGGDESDGGSNYVAGVTEAIEAMNRLPACNQITQIVWLFTDGGYSGKAERLQQRLEQTIKLIQEHDVKLVVVGVGDYHPAMVPHYNEKGEIDRDAPVYKYADGRTMDDTALNEPPLVEFASRAGGTYVHLTEGSKVPIPQAAMKAFLSEDVEQRRGDVYEYPLIAALFLIFVLLTRGGAVQLKNLIVRKRIRN